MTSAVWRTGHLILVLLLLLSAGCGYRVTNGQTGRLGTARTVWVPFFTNETISPTAQTVLRRAFYEELHALRGLTPAESEARADLVMKAKLVKYAGKAVSFNPLDQALVYSLALDVELEIARSGDVPPLWKGQLSGSRQYPANSDLARQRNAEEQALDAVARTIAHSFISALEESY